MPPTGSLSIPRQDLTTAFYQGDTNMQFIGKQILRPMPVPMQTGRLGVVPVEALHNLPQSGVRLSDGGYNRINWKPSDDTWSTVEYGLEIALDDRKANLYKSYFDFEKFHYTLRYNELMRLQEVRIAALLHSGTTFTGSTNTGAAGTAWSTVSATPTADINEGKKQINNKCGLVKIGMQISFLKWMHLSRVTELRSTMAYTRLPSGLIPIDALASMLGLDEILVGNAKKNTANQGLTASLSPVWSDTEAFLYVIPQTDSPEEPCIGRTLYWNEQGFGGDEIVAEEYREERVRGNVGRVRHEVQEKVWSALFGYLITGC